MISPSLSVRSFSDDQYYLDKVFYSNSYLIKPPKNENSIYLDIGSHAGYSVFNASLIGYREIYSFEPFIENYKLLLENIKDLYMANIIPYNLGVYTNNDFLTFYYPPIDNSQSKYLNYGYIEIDKNENNKNNFYKCPCVTLDTIFSKIIEKPIDLLKINIGYAEIDILSNSNLIFNKVSNICGETFETKDLIDTFVKKMFNKGYKTVYTDALKDEENKTLFLLSKYKLEDTFIIN